MGSETNWTAKPLYFGCWSKDELGHYLMDARGVHQIRTDLRPSLLDGKFAPSDIHQKEGLAKTFYLPGYTCIAFWDRSADSRPGSNSVFLVQGTLSFQDALREARKSFPAIFGRFTFSITEYEG